MPTQSAKPYANAKSLGDLKEFYDITSFKDKNVERLCKSLGTVLNKAKSMLKEKDEIGSYIYFMRFLNMYTFIRRTPDIEKIKSLLPKENVNKILEITERLSKSLDERFKLAEQARLKEVATVNTEQKVNSTFRNEENKETVGDANEKTAVNGIRNIGEFSEKDLDGCINPMQLFKLLKPERTSQLGRKESVLILDTRPRKDYAESHMKVEECISVPEEIVQPGLTASKLAQSLPPGLETLWETRTNVDYLVLMDWSSKGGNLNSETAVYRLHNILTKWDPSVNYRSQPLILDGGYEGWLDRYPTYVTNPKPLIPSPSTFNDLLNIDDVEYPNLIDETPTYSRSAKPLITSTMHEKTDEHNRLSNETPSLTVGSAPAFSSQTSLTPAPSIDRSSKAAALQKLEERQARIMEQSEELSRDREAAERNLEILKKQNNDQLGENQKQDLLTQEKHLKERIDSLLKYQQNKEAENEYLRKQLEDYKKRELTAKVRQIPKPLPSLLNNGVKGDVSWEIKPGGDSENVPLKERGEDHSLAEQQLKTAEGTSEESKKPPHPGNGDKDMRSVALYPGQDPHMASSGMKRSRSSPNIAQLGLKCDDEPKFQTPHFDRTTKPIPTKPQSDFFINRQRNFSVVYGNVGRGLTGLKNLGNSCYMNSILQCISNTAPLNDYFITAKYQKDINRSQSNPTKGEVAEEVAHVVRNLWRGEYRSIACRDLKNVVGKYLEQFRGTMQQDSHEFLTFLMDWLHNDLKVRREKVVQEVADSVSFNHIVKSDALTGATKAWNEFKKSNESFILNLFFVQQVSTVKCVHCHEDSVTYEEPTSNLTFLLPSNASRCKLQDCLMLYTNGERISGYKCESCKEQQDAIKKVDLWRLPPILVIHLKRFYSDGFYQKRQTFVDFPLTNLDMRDYTLDPTQRYKVYNLYGVSNHYGTLEGGHYTAFCKNNDHVKCHGHYPVYRGYC